MKQEFTTLAEVSLQLRVPKSKLQYYDHLGLIGSDFTAGKTRFYNKKKLLKAISFIEKEKEKGFSLQQVKEKIIFKEWK
jgi:DNA-binding transcriptional MerR regulator